MVITSDAAASSASVLSESPMVAFNFCKALVSPLQCDFMNALEMPGISLDAIKDRVGSDEAFKERFCSTFQSWMKDPGSAIQHERSLYLYQKNLEVLPAAIGELRNLEEICLYGNQLKFLPDTIGCLDKLRVLYLRNNLFEDFPTPILKLRSLEVLDLDENYLTALPEAIGQLGKIQKLYLKKNALRTLPKGIKDLTELKILNVVDNCLVGPSEIAMPPGIEGFYFSRQTTDLF